MITPKEAAFKLEQKYPKLKVRGGCDYGEYYLLVAYADGREKEIDPYYVVSKKDGSISGYSPAGELLKFSEAMANRPLKF